MRIGRSVIGGGNMSTKPTDLLFRRHRHSESETGTQAPFAYSYGGRDHRDDPNPNTVASAEQEHYLESDSADGSNGGQPEYSATAAKRGAPRVPQTPCRLRTYSGAQTSRTANASTATTRRTQNRGGLAAAHDTEPDDSESDFAQIFSLICL